MRICLVAHGLPPREITGVEVHTAALAAALTRRGARVHAWVPEEDSARPRLGERRESRDGWEVTWVALGREAGSAREAASPPGLAARFGAWLDRERPDLCHVHHLIGLGPELLAEASARGIPVVWTAHDFWAECHRWTLLRPDLSPCPGPERERCARCDLAVAHLNELPGLGDYHVGVDPAALAPEARARLEALLHGDLADAGVGAAARDAAVAERARLDRARLAALADVEAVLVPAEYLRARLLAAGFDARRVHLRPYALPTAELAGLAAPDPRAAGRPVRFGFVGGVVKHKGLHVLLEAFGRLDVPAELVVHGDSSDRPYVDRVRAAAERVGARWCGAFAPDELPRVLAELDVLVVPSLWSENQPFVIREAFAAHRPVVASATPALAECVRDGVDGLLVPAGDAGALAAALGRLAGGPEEVARLAAAAPAIPDLEDEAGALLELYGELVDRARARARDALPCLPSVRPLAERHAELVRTPAAELHARVQAGLATLAGDLGLGTALAERPGEEPAAAARLRARFDEARDEIAWLRRGLAAAGEAEDALRERARWRERTADDRRAAVEAERARADQAEAARAASAEELDWRARNQASLEAELAWRAEAQAALEQELEWLRSNDAAREQELAWRGQVQAALEEELEWLRSNDAAREAERGWLAERASAAEAERDELLRRSEAAQEELAWRRGVLEAREHELAWRRRTTAAVERERDHVAARADAAEAERDALRGERDALRGERDALAAEASWRHGNEEEVAAERDWLRSLLEARDAELAWRGEQLEELERELAWLRESRAGLERQAEADRAERAHLVGRLEQLEHELDGRRAEMEAAVNDLVERGALTRRLLARTAVGRRLLGWRGEEGP